MEAPLLAGTGFVLVDHDLKQKDFALQQSAGFHLFVVLSESHAEHLSILESRSSHERVAVVLRGNVKAA
jgi:hypothetical protein